MTHIEDNVIAFHESKSECWRAKGYERFAEAHTKRAEAIKNGASLTDRERDGDGLDVMAEIAESAKEKAA